MLQSCHDWWNDHPALLYGLALLLGYSEYWAPGWHLLPPSIALWSPTFPAYYYKKWTLALRLTGALILAICAYLHGIATLSSPLLPPEGLKGQGILSFYNLAKKESAHGGHWHYKGILSDFYDLPPLKISLALPTAKTSLPPDVITHWLVSGTLVQHGDRYSFKANSPSTWQQGNYNFYGHIASLRYHLHNALASYLSHVLDTDRSAPFLNGMVTGNFDDNVLRYHFSRFGVQHLLAISGFHFALVTAGLGILLSPFLSRKQALYTLLVILALYCAFLGSSPSILRAWISISLTLFAYLIARRPHALNIMGVALCIVLIIDPKYLSEVAFQLSFAITAAILLFTRPLDRLLQYLITTRTLSTVIGWERSCQHGYIIAITLRQTLALGFAVNLAAFPLTLYHFHTFPWLSLFYNLFFPLFVTFSLLMLLLGSLLHLALGPLGLWLHSFNSVFTHYLVGLAADAPPSFNWAFYGTPSPFLVSLFLTITASAGAYIYTKGRSQGLQNELPFTI